MRALTTSNAGRRSVVRMRMRAMAVAISSIVKPFVNPLGLRNPAGRAIA